GRAKDRPAGLRAFPPRSRNKSRSRHPIRNSISIPEERRRDPFSRAASPAKEARVKRRRRLRKDRTSRETDHDRRLADSACRYSDRRREWFRADRLESAGQKIR